MYKKVFDDILTTIRTSISGSDIVYVDSYSSVSLFSVPSASSRALVPNTTYLAMEGDVHEVKVSPDGKYVAMAHDAVKVEKLLKLIIT